MAYSVALTNEQWSLLRPLSGCFEGSAESALAWLEVACFGYLLGYVSHRLGWPKLRVRNGARI